MRLLLAAAVFLHSAQAAEVGMNQPCNKELDGLLATDPTGNPNTFLSCVGVGVGSIGFWERKVCPNDMVFDFINQQCKAKRKKSRKQQTLNIAILNNSCAQGETCIGGTVCDLDTLRCLCPYGTIPQVETLSCIKKETTPAFNFNNFNFETAFTPTAEFFKPNPNYKSQVTNFPNYRGGSEEQSYSGSSSSWQPFTGPGGGDFKPNSNQFVFSMFSTSPAPMTTPKVPILAHPGQSCRNDEVCSGGSICTQPISLCLCPGELEARDGECVLPASAAIQISKVGIGALCSELAECDHGSSCIMGRCACVAPLVQHQGKCVLRQESKKVGPGELCDNGEVCIKGSVCDSVIPVCVCPPDTDLKEGECIRVAPKTAAPRPATYIPAMTAPPPTRPPPPPPSPPPPSQAPFTHPAPTYVPPTHPPQPLPPYRPPQTQVVPAPLPSTVNYQSFTAPPPVRTTAKPNHMKINLGGSKQAGVGVRCALNTDCMIGAYCNGNTNPPSCQCLSTHVNIEGRCEKIVYPGQIGCRSDLQCSSAYTGTSCIDRVCVCPEGNKAVDQTCVPECNPACPSPLQCVNSQCLPPKRNRFSRDISGLVCYPGANICSSGDGVCLEGKCRCLKGWQPRDGACRPLEVPLGASCAGQEVVCQEEAVCDGGICRCRYPGRCSPPVGRSPGSCTADSECRKNETCANGKCICLGEESRCYSAAPVYKNLNSACWGTDRCAGGSVCKDSVCQCTDGSTEIYGRCQQLPGGRCLAGQTCTSGSVCDFGLCRCEDGYNLLNGACTLAAAMPGKSCQLGQKCLHGSACRFGVCMCVGKTIALGDKCVRRQELASKVAEVLPGTLKGPGMECNPKDFCAGGSKCLEGMCSCADHEVIIDEQCIGDAKKAVEVVDKLNIAAPGQSCDAKTVCSGGSLCIDKMCQCEEGKVSEEGSCKTPPSAAPPKKPVKELISPGNLCTLTMECPFRTECVRGVCRCKRGETIVDGACRSAIHQVLPGGRCDPRNGYDCVGESHCIYGTCTCLKQLVNLGKLCVTPTEITIIPIGKRCTPELICAGNSRCLHGICRCKEDEVPDVNGKCAKKTQVYPVYNTFVGSTTAPPRDKFQNKIDEIEELELEIKNNPQAALGENTPNSVSLQILYGSRCQNNPDCPDNAYCQYGQCHCIPNYRATAGYCERVSRAGENCQSTNQCEVNAFCLNGKCACTSNDGTTCSSPNLRRPGELCGDGKICAFNSYCGIMSGVCECPSGMSTQDFSCQQTAIKPGMACVTSRNCHKYSYCDNGYCLCKTGYDLIGGFCVPTKGGETMTSTDYGPEMPPNRNDGPQAPMQERIRTESFMKLNPSGSAGTAYEFGPGRVNTQGETDQTMDNFHGQWTEQPSFYNGFSQSSNQEELNFQPNVYNGGPRKPLSFHSGKSFGISNQEREEAFNPGDVIVTTESVYEFTTHPYKIILPAGANPDILTAAVPAPFVFQPPFPYARASNTKSGDVPAATTISTTSSASATVSQVRVAMPGEYCADGSVCLGNSVCRGQFCRCPNSSSAENGICIQRKRFHPGKPIINDAPTQQDKEELVEERQFSAPLENCQNFEFCTAGSECLNINGMGLICQCPVAKIFLDEECVDNPKNAELAGIGDSCGGGVICLGGSSCVKEVCVCGEGKREILGICVATAQPGDDCGKGEICVDGSVCVGEMRTCVCPPGRVSKAGRCVEDLESLSLTTGAAYPGEDCSRHVICMDNSFCDGGGKCQCLPKFRNVKGRCVPASMVRDVGEPCPPGTICSGGACTAQRICSCGEGQLEISGSCVEIPKNVSRRPPRAICKSDSDCQERFNCTQSLCTCEGENCMNFLLQDNDSECEKDKDCPEKSTCQEGMCICDDGYRREMKLCVERHPEVREHLPLWKQVFGKKIVTEEEMEKQANETESQEHVWTHEEEKETDLIEEAQGSLKKKKMPWEKSLAVTTIPWEPQEPKESQVKATISLGDLFKYKVQDPGDITLVEKLPTVTRTRVPFLKMIITPSQPKKPSKLASFYVGPGASCVGKRKCGEGSICFDGSCVCSYEDLPVNDECVPRDTMVRFGHRCLENQRCHEGLVCVFNKCQCPFGVETDVCNPNEPVTSPPGGSCTEARECTGGSVCREGWCICPDPTMIVQKGICIQSGPRPTLPSRIVPVYTTAPPSYAAPASGPVFHPTNPPTSRTFNALPSPQQPSRKRTPGSQCGPLDTCVGGSTCVEGLCVCPAGMSPSMNGRCELAQPSTVFVPSWEPRLPSTPDYIELPPAGGTLPTTHAPPLIQTNSNSNNECEAIGLFCRGNTICVNKSCQCPDGHILHNDGCVPPTDTKRRKSRGKARHQVPVVAASQYSRPGESCSLGQVCTGGSTCVRDTQLCTCPPEKPLIKSEYCQAAVPVRRQAVSGESCDENTDCINNSACHAGQCRCPPQYVAVSGHCLRMPMQTTPAMKVIAKPLESCDDGEVCTGGSTCDDDTGYCMCPPGQVAFDGECRHPPTAAPRPPSTTTRAPVMIITTPRASSAECSNDAQCSVGKTCIAGRCRCRPGTMDNGGICEPIEDLEAGERPVPISYARHRALTEPRLNTTEHQMASPPDPLHSEKPRIVGPPIRRPKPKPKSGSGGGGGGGRSGGGATGPGDYKTGGSGAGNCPPGNDPTRDDSGRLLMCNGLEPNCPPRSYCFITSGGFATEEYNCCKSW